MHLSSQRVHVPIPIIKYTVSPLILEDVPSLKDSLLVAVKDNLCTKDFGTTCSSAMLQRPSHTRPYGLSLTYHTLERVPSTI